MSGYEIWTKDGFDIDAEAFHLAGKFANADGIKDEYETLQQAEEAASAYLKLLDERQPDAAGQGPFGIQDHVYIHFPAGGIRRIFH